MSKLIKHNRIERTVVDQEESYDILKLTQNEYTLIMSLLAAVSDDTAAEAMRISPSDIDTYKLWQQLGGPNLKYPKYFKITVE